MAPVDSPIRRMTDTTHYRTVESVMVECDWLEDHERGMVLNQVALTRAEYDLLMGRSSDRDTVAKLRTELGIPTSKRVTVVLTTTGRRSYRRHATDAAVLTQTLGPYYMKLSVPFSILNAEEICHAWDSNPIQTLEVSMIPGNVNPATLASDRFRRVNNLSLHFVSGSLNDVFTLLTSINCEACVLELRNIQATDQMLKVLLQRMKPKWKFLKSITLARRTP